MELKEVLDKALIVVEEAAVFIRSQAGKVRDEEIITKSKNSLVSFVDQTAEEILVTGLGKVLPEAGFITEEETVEQQTSEYTWIIDPLDGTTNFLQQIPLYAVSVGLVHNGTILLGIVCDIENHETFYAWKGGGAWCNGDKIHVSTRSRIDEAIVATGFPYAARGNLPKLSSAFDFFLNHASGIRRLGSAAIDLAYVACGRFDIYYETTLNAWDIAGGIILVNEAGGETTDFKGGNHMLDKGEVIAGPKEIHKTVLTHLRVIFDA